MTKEEFTNSKCISFDDVKQFFLDSIDDADSINDLFFIVIQKVYKKGLCDGFDYRNDME